MFFFSDRKENYYNRYFERTLRVYTAVVKFTRSQTYFSRWKIEYCLTFIMCENII